MLIFRYIVLKWTKLTVFCLPDFVNLHHQKKEDKNMSIYGELFAGVMLILAISALEVMAIYKYKHLMKAFMWVMCKLDGFFEEEDEKP